jgi:SAM-dependent methyltransferase
MLITERFAWAHLPKTAGAATHAMFDAVPGLVEWADPQDSNAKHDPFWQHEDQVGGKLLVMNIRRLPSWVLSHAHHKAVEGAWPEFEPQPMLTVEEMVEGKLPDDALRRMTDGSRFPIDRWLRQENLVKDVVTLLEDVGAFSDEARGGIATVPYRAKGYDHDVASTFTAAQIQRMYMLNPAWAEIEKRVYGDIHELARPGTFDSPTEPSRGRIHAPVRSRAAEPGLGESLGNGDDAASLQRARYAADEIDVDSWLTSIWGPELEAIDRKLAEVGPRIDNFALFRDLDDDLWALLLGRRYSTYKSILETLPHLPDPSLQQRWNGAHGMTLLGQSKAFYRHARAMYREHGNGDYGAGRILDFGCGWGRLTRFFARDVNLGGLHGCDPVEETIKICRRSRLPAVLHRSELVPDELQEGNFDLAFSFSVFTHFSEAAANTCLRALHTALNPRGLLILSIRPPAYLDLDTRMHAARDELRPDPVTALSEPRYVFVPHTADPGDPRYAYGETTSGQAVISLPYIRDRWGELFELLDVKVLTEDMHHVLVTLRKR